MTHTDNIRIAMEVYNTLIKKAVKAKNSDKLMIYTRRKRALRDQLRWKS